MLFVKILHILNPKRIDKKINIIGKGKRSDYSYGFVRDLIGLRNTVVEILDEDKVVAKVESFPTLLQALAKESSYSIISQVFFLLKFEPIQEVQHYLPV